MNKLYQNMSDMIQQSKKYFKTLNSICYCKQKENNITKTIEFENVLNTYIKANTYQLPVNILI